MQGLLTDRQLRGLLSLLNPKPATAQKSFASVSAQVKQTLPGFKTGCALCSILLQSPKQLQLLSTESRLLTIYCLWELFREHGESIKLHPFLEFLLNLVDNETVSSIEVQVARDVRPLMLERQLTVTLLVLPRTTALPPFAKMTPAQFIRSFPLMQYLYGDLKRQVQQQDTTTIQPVLLTLQRLRDSVEKSKELFGLASVDDHGIVPFLVLPDSMPTLLQANPVPEQKQVPVLKDMLTLAPFQADFDRIPPPTYPASSDELIWLDWTKPQDYIWDYSMGVGGDSKHNELKQLITRACKGALTAAKKQQLLAELKQDGSVARSGLTPERLPALVEKNPFVATAVIVLLGTTSSPQLAEYLHMLVSMDLSLQSVEVVNELTQAANITLPEQFISMYVAHCIASCEKITNQYSQNRLVRLVCVFLQRAIRNGTIHGDHFVELLQFTVQFARVKDAAKLYQLLKSME